MKRPYYNITQRFIIRKYPNSRTAKNAINDLKLLKLLRDIYILLSRVL